MDILVRHHGASVEACLMPPVADMEGWITVSIDGESAVEYFRSKMIVSAIELRLLMQLNNVEAFKAKEGNNAHTHQQEEC